MKFGIGRFLALSLLFAAPSLFVAGILAATGRLSADVALIAALASAAGTAGLVFIFYRDAMRISSFVDRIADRPSEPPPSPRPASALGQAIAGRLALLHRTSRQRESALRREIASSAQLIDALHDPLLVLNRRRVVTRANSAATALFDARIEGRDLAATVRHPDVLAAVDAVLAGGTPRSLDFVQPVPVEAVFQVRVQSFAHPPGAAAHTARGAEEEDRGPSEPAALLTLHDITQTRRIEQMRADFVANASHELRTPLSALTGFIETLMGPARDDAAARDRFLAIMRDQAGRMARLVSDLLSLSRIELDERTAPTARADLAAVLRRVIATLQIRAQDRDMRVDLTLDDDTVTVLGDEDQLVQVFQNLIDNAIKYGRPGTAVSVTVATMPAAAGRGPTVSVSVRDQGDGIDKPHLPRLTERFYRVDAARSRQIGGTGLGLAIVKHIVSRHRGRLAIESELGRGSVFTVSLPLVTDVPG
ncbi:MAG: ATP-binding protein [Inquilinaceae bacterium]